MTDEERGNSLEKPVRELCVHGKYYRSETDQNGVYGAWWVRRSWLREQLGQEEVDEAIKTFRADLDTESDEE